MAILELNKSHQLIEILKRVEFELESTNGLYAADNENFIEPFQIDFTDIINTVQQAISLCEEAETKL